MGGSRSRGRGGSRGGGGGGQSFSDPMGDYLSQMQAAEEARRQALLEQQRQAALAEAQKGESLAKQQLSQYGTQQQALDQESLISSKQAQSAAGSKAIAGGGGQVNQSEKASSVGIGGGAAMAAPQVTTGLTQIPANMGASGTGQPANMFKLPSAANLTFGGS